MSRTTTLAAERSFALIATELAESEAILTATLAPYDSPIGGLVRRLENYRGKRLRPALLLLAAKASGEIRPAHAILAAVVEMIHTATLVHDDVLDEADIRRHSATINAEWGNKVAILFGDTLFTHAFHLSSTVDVRACRLIGEATNRVCAGELRQVCHQGRIDLSEEEYFAVIDGKTAALTEVSTRLGAIYAGAEEHAESLATYGAQLGLAFQIADDLLDLVGDEQTAGKTLGTDLKQRKMTLPLILALVRLPKPEGERLRSALEKETPDLTQLVSEALTKTGAIEAARTRAFDHAEAARAALERLPESPARSILENLTKWAVRREK